MKLIYILLAFAFIINSASATATTIMLKGDSITLGYISPLYYLLNNNSIKEYNFIGTQGSNPLSHEAYSGESILSSMNRLESVPASTPDMIILNAGTVDVGRFQTYDNTETYSTLIARLSNLVDQLSVNYPNSKIFVLSVAQVAQSDSPNWGKTQDVLNKQTLGYNSLIPGMVNEKQQQGLNVGFIDLYNESGISLYPQGVDYRTPADGHPNDVGSMKLAKVIYNHILNESTVVNSTPLLGSVMFSQNSMMIPLSISTDKNYTLTFSAYSDFGQNIGINGIHNISLSTTKKWFYFDLPSNSTNITFTFLNESDTYHIGETVVNEHANPIIIPTPTSTPTPTLSPTPIPTPTQNIILNPSFESGTTSWYPIGIGAFVSTPSGYESANAAKITLNSGGGNIQLLQTGIALEANVHYRLSFAAYSNTGHDATVRIIKHVSPYTLYMPDFTVNLGTDWQTFTTEFTSIYSFNDGRLMFWLTPYATGGDIYYIDNIKLERI